VYPEPRVTEFVSQNFIPVRLHVKTHPEAMGRFGADWTPTVMLLDSNGQERHRIEGFLPADDFLAQLELGLGHLYFKTGRFPEAEKQFREAVSLTPFDALAHAGLAEVLVATQRFPAAREEARSSLRLKPVPEAYLVMARLALVENQPDEATQNLDQALALDPANAAALALKKDIAARTANRARNP